MMDFKITYDKPLNEEEWNKLALENSNLICSTHSNEGREYYRQKLIYLHFLIENKLVAGVKLNFWESQKLSFLLPWLSRTISQFGEYIIADEYVDNDELRKFIEQQTKTFILEKNPVKYSASGYYGNIRNLIMPFQSTDESYFDVAVIDVTQSEENLMKNLHAKHRNHLRKGLKSNLTFEKDVDVQILIDLLQETYIIQDKTPPSYDYIKTSFEGLKKYENATIYAVKKENQYLSATMITHYGVKAQSAFTGNIKNSFGAGQFLHWNVILDLQRNSYTEYSLGQVAIEGDETNQKFSIGISEFKNRFGTKRNPCFKKETIFSGFRNSIWNILVKVLT